MNLITSSLVFYPTLGGLDRRFQVTWDLKKGSFLHGGNYSKEIFWSEKDAWEHAKKLAKKLYGKAVNFYVVVSTKDGWIPVKGYRRKIIKNRQTDFLSEEEMLL